MLVINGATEIPFVKWSETKREHFFGCVICGHSEVWEKLFFFMCKTFFLLKCIYLLFQFRTICFSM